MPTAIFTYALSRHGIPALRHDWFWPRSGESNFYNVLGLAQGWSNVGIGVPNFRPTGYLVAIVLGPIIALFGPWFGFLVWCVVLGALCSLAASYVCSQFGVGGLGRTSLVTLALLNPWTYTEIVAGHHLMLIGYAGFLLLSAAMFSEDVGARGTALCCALLVHQTQYIVVATVVAAYDVVRRRSPVALATTFVLAAPFTIGIVANFRSVEATPYTVDWIRSLALTLPSALTLTGYFTHYDAAYDGLGRVAIWALVAVAAIGIFGNARDPRVRGAVVLGASTLGLTLVIANASDPLLVPFFARFSALQLFRDPYTMLSLVAVMLLVGAAAAIGRRRLLGVPCFVAAAVSALVWVRSPPSAMWSDLRSVPNIAVTGGRGERFALEPALQPLRFDGDASSGLDPDVYPRTTGAMPLNGVDFAFPEVVALSRLLCYGDTRDIRALGVSELFERPWLSSDVGALRDALAGDNRCLGRTNDVARHRIFAARPLLAMTALPPVGSLANDQRSSAVFFGDIAGLVGPSVPPQWRSFDRVEPVAAPRERTVATEDWVDTRLVYFAHPDLGQAFGGAYTEQSARGLRIPRSRWFLASVDGSLLDDTGRVLATGRGSFVWYERGRAGSVFCRGRCAVVATTDRVPSVPLNPSRRGDVDVPLAPLQQTSWLYVARIPASSRDRLLRFDVRFDRAWLALLGRNVLAHIRINSTINGWIVPKTVGGDVVLIESTAALQACSIGIALVWLAALLVVECRRWRRAR
ncbi:MAG: hypothetical protein NVSMB21_14620 [Vulcanimicrobiaceae bacterium]